MKQKQLEDMEMMDIAAGIMDDRKDILENIRTVWQLATEKAEKEYQYKKAFAIEVERLRIEKTPATIIKDLAEGEVAEKRRDMELASGKFRAALASLDALQTSLQALQSVLKHLEKV